MNFNVITGLPRSGSTLLCNLLNQNPKFRASSTSAICSTVATLSNLWSNSLEMQSELANDPEGTPKRMLNACRALIEEWYDMDERTIFDKSRGWGQNGLLLKQLFPNAKIIAMVRDPRGVYGSIEKQHRVNPILDLAEFPAEKEVYNRADSAMAANGLIGSSIAGVMDLHRRGIEGTTFVQFEALVENPKRTMENLYDNLGEEYFEHDFENVINTATDADHLYLNKFPHKGDGKVQGPDVDEWKQFVSPDLAAQIMTVYPLYNRTFGYV